jgi:transposase
MLYLGIDQHAKQLTVCQRDEAGDVVLRRQVSTQPEKVRAFMENVRQAAEQHGGFVAIVEVCSFNEWLVKLLPEFGCQEVVVVQPEKRSRRKTDRRDAARLSELLWINRDRLLAGKRVQGLRRVHVPEQIDAENRRLTSLRHRLGQSLTRTINRIKRLVHRHNLIHEQPTKTFQTKAVRKWLAELKLDDVDRLEMDQLLAQWTLTEQQLAAVQCHVDERAAADPNARCLASLTGGRASFTSLAIASRVGPIERFRSARSFTNFFGLTPTCANSGESGDCLGHISKEGSPIVRFLLGQLVLHMLRRDPHLNKWYRQVKRRRGAKIARVAVMRKLAASIWHMLKHQESYVPAHQRQEATAQFAQAS